MVAVDGLDAVGSDTDGARRRDAGHRDRSHRTRRLPPTAVAAARREAELAAHWGRARCHRRRARRCDPRQRAGRRCGARRARNPGRGRRAVPHRAVLPQPRHRADRRRAGTDLRRRARGLLGTQGRDPDAGRRVGQAAEIRRPSRRGQPCARRAGHPDRRGQPWAAGPAAGRDRRRGRAHRQRAVGDGADDRHRRGGRTLCRPGPFTTDSLRA